MERLTERTGVGCWRLKGLPWQHLREEHELNRTDCELICGALYKLRDYEVTGLDPEDVRAQRAENQLLKDALVKSATPGKWELVDGAMGVVRCSVCGRLANKGILESLDDYAAYFKFCSNCGARMDGGKEDAD